MIGMIACVAKNNVIGCDGQIPWHIKGEQTRFKELTMHQVVIMGRNTYHSLFHDLDRTQEVLPNRVKIVVTSHEIEVQNEFIHAASSLKHAIQMAKDLCPDKDIYLIGGASIYSEGMQYADTLFINELRDDILPNGDTFFPPIDLSAWEKINIGSNSEQFNCFTYVRKIRIWDKKCEKMYSDIVLPYPNRVLHLKENHVVMICTGMYDEKSCLIFEDDYLSDGVTVFRVYCSDNACRFLARPVAGCTTRGGHDYNLFYLCKTSRIVGNQYQYDGNPGELLYK